MATEEEDKFYPDDLLPALFRNEQDDYFCLGLVMNWPPTTIASASCMKEQYDDFLSTVQKQCFQEEEDARDSFFFCMPFHSLHITVASLFPAHRKSRSATEDDTSTPSTTSLKGPITSKWQSTFVAEWMEVLSYARTLQGWPHEPFHIHIESAQIRPRAGILLWADPTGGIKRIRQCLLLAVQSIHPHLQVHLKIPNIIHTTFVRYTQNDDSSRMIRSRPSVLHSILVNDIVPNHPLFAAGTNAISQNPNATIQVDCTKLVSCNIYLQSQGGENDHTVFLTLPFS